VSRGMHAVAPPGRGRGEEWGKGREETCRDLGEWGTRGGQ
jgi:hypothetical protein